MSRLFQQLQAVARQHPAHIALRDTQGSLSYSQLFTEVRRLTQQLQSAEVQHAGIWLENSRRWVIVQLAALQSGVRVTPIPPFFSLSQQRHLCQQTGMDILFTDKYQHALLLDHHFRPGAIDGSFQRLSTPAAVPDETCLITFTSGTTGTPKGVCLSEQQLIHVCRSLLEQIQPSADSMHLCLTPLAVLLENLAGVFVPLLNGACSLLLPPAKTGLRGSSQFNALQFANSLNHYRPDSLILMPEFLKALVTLTEQQHIEHYPRFIAVGGGLVSSSLLARAERLGLPVYQGYGLSECASVVSLNTLAANRPGSVGKPLPHCQVRLAPDGEILVSGNNLPGYLGSNRTQPPETELATGDYGWFDEEGYLYIRGRKKNLMITSQGRNLCPEWLEAELTALPAIQQACVFADGRADNLAIISHTASKHEVTRQIQQLNTRLPDYARIAHWLPSQSPFTPGNRQLTANGRLKRRQITEDYAALLAAPHTTIDCLNQQNSAQNTSQKTGLLSSQQQAGTATAHPLAPEHLETQI